MAREIAIREEFLDNCDESTLERILQALGREYLLITLDDYRIEVSELDYAAVCQALNEIKRDIESNTKG